MIIYFYPICTESFIYEVMYLLCGILWIGFDYLFWSSNNWVLGSLVLGIIAGICSFVLIVCLTRLNTYLRIRSITNVSLEEKGSKGIYNFSYKPGFLSDHLIFKKDECDKPWKSKLIIDHANPFQLTGIFNHTNNGDIKWGYQRVYLNIHEKSAYIESRFSASGEKFFSYVIKSKKK